MITAREIEAVIGAPVVGEEGDACHAHAVADSRKVAPGDLFVALRGERTDGHDFVADGAARGATAAIVARAVPVDVTQYVAPDPLAAIQELARRKRTGLPGLRVVGVTGSVGKTTTKEICAAVLSTRYRLLKSEGNLNSEIGLPLVLLELDATHERAVLEMGMWAPGEMALLCDLAQPDVGVVTMVGPVHLERLGSIDAIAREKAVLPQSLPASGTAVLNADDARVAAMAAGTRVRVLMFGLSATAGVRAEDLAGHGLAGASFTLAHGNERARVRTVVPAPLVRDALAAAAVALADGFALADVAAAISDARPQMRYRVLRGVAGAMLIDDSYNASPASMRSALDLLAETPGRRVAVLGDMRELGGAEQAGHHEVGLYAAAAADVIVTVGALGRTIGEAARDAGHSDVRTFEDKAETITMLRNDLRGGDVVLVKGSRALELETLADALREDA